MRKIKKIPKSLQGALWSVDISKLDLEKDRAYIVNQVLSYGTLEEIRWLMGMYGEKTVREVFLNQPMKVYTKPCFALIKNALLNLSQVDISEEKYVQAFY